MASTIPVIGILSLLVCAAMSQDSCPANECRCEAGPPGEGRVINCRNKGLSSIPALRASQELFYEITFGNSEGSYRPNVITSIPGHAFAGLRVKVIDLGRNSLTRVSNEAFLSVSSDLQELILEGNGYISAPYRALSVLTNLKTLSLANFHQRSITQHNTNVRNLVNLEKLTLKNMDILYITQNAFEGRLPKLRTLHLEFLKLNRFPIEGLAPLTTLEEIRAIYINLKRLEFRSFNRFKNLKELDLSHNDIAVMEPGCFHGIEDSLEYLGLHLNNLSESSVGALASPRWTRLRNLNLGHNRMQSIPDGLFFNMNKLQYLNLDSNAINSLEQGSLHGLGRLIYLDLSYNSLQGLTPGVFQHTPLLRELDLRGQNTRAFNITPEGIRGLHSNLERLILTHTPVRENDMWRAIGHLRSIKDLQLVRIGLTAIPNFQFVNNPYLDTLMLDNNQISDITQRNFYGLNKSLKTLHIQGNRIRTVDRCAFGNMTNIKYLYLGRNPLHCDCRLAWLRNWMVEQIALDPSFKYTVGAQCSSPTSLKNKDLWTTKLSELPCEGQQFHVPTCEDLSSSVVTTANPLPEVTSESSSSEPSIFRFTRIVETDTGISLEWVTEEIRMINGFKLEYQILGHTADPIRIDLAKSENSYEISDLTKDSHYLLCMTTKPRVRNILREHRSCIAVRTLP